ncbi:tetratricopeptide repeat protein [bacterium]|nr:tetratricopeptide repeat protein [bacterium]
MQTEQTSEKDIVRFAWIGAGSLAALVMLVSFLPPYIRCWGLDGLSYNSPLMRFIVLIVAGLISLVLYVALRASKADERDTGNLILWLAFLPIILGSFLYPAATLLRGDGQLLVNNLSAGYPITLRAPVVAMITSAIYNFGASFGLNAVGTYRIVDALACCLFVAAFWRFSLRYENITGRLFVVLAGVFSGSLLLLSGLVEQYALLHAALAWSLVLSVEAIEDDRLPSLGLLINLIAIGVHVSAIAFLPAYLFAFLRDKPIRTTAIVTGGVGLAGVVFVWIFAGKHLLFPLGPYPPDGYAVYSLRHLIDLLNLDFWAVPLLIGIILPILLLKRIDILEERSDWFLFAAMIGAMGFALLFSPDYGLARDADLVALYGIPATFWLVRSWWNNYLPTPNSLVAAMLFAGLITIGTQLSVQARPVADAERFIRQLERNPERSYYGWEVIAILRRGLGDAEGERIAYERALSAPELPEEDNVRYLNNLAGIEMKRNNFEIAKSYLMDAVRIDPDYALTHGLLGKLYGEIGEKDSAEVEFQRAIEIDPQSGTLYANYGGWLVQEGRVQEAVEMLKSGVLRIPDSPQLLFTLGFACEKMGQNIEALRWYEKARSLAPNSPWGINAAVAHKRLSLMPGS